MRLTDRPRKDGNSTYSQRGFWILSGRLPPGHPCPWVKRSREERSILCILCATESCLRLGGDLAENTDTQHTSYEFSFVFSLVVKTPERDQIHSTSEGSPFRFRFQMNEIMDPKNDTYRFAKVVDTAGRTKRNADVRIELPPSLARRRWTKLRRPQDSLAPRASQSQGRALDDDVHAARVDKNRTYTGHRAPPIICVLNFLDERALPLASGGNCHSSLQRSSSVMA